MDLNLNQNYKKVLDKEFKKFKSFLLDTDESFYSYEKKDLECLFLFSIVDNTNAIKNIKKKLLNNNITEKSANRFFYSIMKFKYKNEKGLYSWNEIEEWNIDLDEVKETTTKYTLI